MSDYGVFEASSTDGYEEDQRQRQATRDLGRAIEAAREGFGDFLGAATDKQDYKDRLALVMNDLMQKVADSGVMPVPGVMRKVKAALRPEFKTNFTPEDYARHSSRKHAAKCPKCDGMGREVYEKDSGSLSTQTCTECGGTGEAKEASRKQAGLDWDKQDYNYWSYTSPDSGLDYWIKDRSDGQIGWSVFDYLSGQGDAGTASSFDEAEQYIADFISKQSPDAALNQLGSRRHAGPEEGGMKSEEELSQLFEDGENGDNFKKSRRKTADDYVKGDALNFINHLQNGGYRMPKDAGYPGEGGQMDDELYDYTNGDQNRIAELVRFLQENWDYYAYGASRTAGAGDWEQTYDGADEWVCKRNPRLRILEEDRGYYLFDNIDLIEVTNTFEQAMELAESHYEGSRKVAVEWRFDDMGMGEFDWQSWWTVPEESAQASNGVQGLVVEDATGKGGYNWLIQDIATSDDLQDGNAPTVEEAKSAVEQAMSRYAKRKSGRNL